MSKLNRYSNLVKDILEGIPQTRNSDELLYLHVLDRLSKKADLVVDPTNLTLVQFISFRRRLNYPTIETIGRIRRRMQELYKELRADINVEAHRELLEKEFIRYAQMGGIRNGRRQMDKG